MSTSLSESDRDHRPRDTFVRDLVSYVLARLALVVVITVPLALVPGVPLLVALIVGFFLGMPLGLLLLRSLNERVTAGLAARNERRAAERARLRAELRGAAGPDEAGATAGPANGTGLDGTVDPDGIDRKSARDENGPGTHGTDTGDTGDTEDGGQR